MVTAKETLTGNCTLLNSIVKSEGIKGILGIKASSPAAGPVKIVASITLLRKAVTCNRVLLHNLGGLRFRSNIVGVPIFNRNLYRGNPGGSNELRNLVGKFVASAAGTECKARYSLSVPGNISKMELFNSSAELFSGVRIAVSQSQVYGF